MGMLKKIFNWKTTSERDRFGTSPEISRSSKSNAQNQQIASAQDRPYHSEADLDSREFKSTNDNTRKPRSLTETGILMGSNVLQEVSSTVVCDYGEMDASSPAVQQVSTARL
jgi:hypothetical protein